MKFFFLLLLILCKPNEKLPNSLNSIQAVLETSMKAIQENDSSKLDSILLTRKEHNELFWKHIGEKFLSDKSMTSDLAYDFMDYETKAVKEFLFKEFKNKKFLIDKSYCQRVEIYGPFKLHLGCRIKLKDLNGSILEIDNIRSVVELNDSFKLYHLRK